MANDAFAINFVPPQAVERTFLASSAFIALLLLVFVGMNPFSPPIAVSQFGGVQGATSGDTLRQILYLAVFSLIVLCAVQRRGFSAVAAIPFSMILLLGWCLLSSLWAAEPGIALRRAGLEVVVVISALLSVDTIGADRAFRLWRILLAIILVVNWISIPLIATARHLPGEIDPALVGNWRGLYGHKNIAGAVCVMTALLFLFTRNGWRNWIGILVAIAATAFLVMTRSKTSLGFLPLAILAGVIYRIGWRDSLSRAILTAAAILLLVGLAALAILDADAIAHALEDPAEFTGRAAIWSAELAYIRDHLLLGAGFGTFADTGGQSPLHNYISGSWVEAVSHGHNGYLQLLVTIGGVGFLLALLALFVEPIRWLWGLDWSGDGFKPLLFALFLFLVLHNVMESDFLEGDGVNWVAFLLMLGALRQIDSRHSTYGNR
jgi:exopolysaccharide production protein ExoQ